MNVPALCFRSAGQGDGYYALKLNTNVPSPTGPTANAGSTVSIDTLSY